MAKPVTAGVIFTAKQVVDSVGISYRQLDYWTTTKLIRPSITNSKGSGNFREFSDKDVLHVSLIKDLLSHGYDLQHVRLIAHEVRKCLNHIEPDKVLVVDGTQVQVMDWFDATVVMSNSPTPVTVWSMRKIQSRLQNEADGER